MEARQYERLQTETEALAKKNHEKDASVPLFHPVPPLLVVDTKDFEGHG